MSVLTGGGGGGGGGGGKAKNTFSFDVTHFISDLKT